MHTLSKSDFTRRLSSIISATSLKGKKYKNIYTTTREIIYTRESGNTQQIGIDELYQIYVSEPVITYGTTKRYLENTKYRRRYSPAVAILFETGLYDRNTGTLQRNL